jgi:hypothetical protein
MDSSILNVRFLYDGREIHHRFMSVVPAVGARVAMKLNDKVTTYVVNTHYWHVTDDHELGLSVDVHLSAISR